MAVKTQVVDAEQLIVKHLDLWTSAQTAKSTAGRGSNNKIELTGIKKLRELILELAVRGKLVPQDSNDEPASELLKRIAAEKSVLFKSGELKKSQTLTSVSDDEKPFDLPTGWVWTRLGVVTSYGVSDKAEANDVNEQTWVLELEDIEKETSRLIQKVRFSSREFKSTKSRFKKNDILYGKLRPYLDKVIVADEDGVCTTEIIPIRSYGGCDPNYIKWMLKTPRFIKYADESCHGMNLPRLGTEKGENALIAIAPSKEQQKISDKVSALMIVCDQLAQQSYQSIDAHNQLVDTLLQTLVDSANADELASNWQRLSEHFDTLFTTEYSIDALKQTILQLAVMGKLVKQDPTDEPASELLKRIAKEKEALIKAGKIKKQKPLPPITDDEKPFELPKGWEWCRLAEISSIKGGFAYKSTEFIDTGDAQVIRMGNVRPDYFRLDENPVYIDGKYAQLTKDYEVLEGEIVITMTGTKGKRDYLYSVLVEPGDVRQRPLFLNQRLCSARPVIVVSELLSLFMKDSRLLDMVYAKSTGSANQANIGMEAISNWLIPLPPLNEQSKIIAKFVMVNDICSKLTNRLEQIRSIHYLFADTLVEQVII